MIDDEHQLEIQLYDIIEGKTRIKVFGNSLYVKEPSVSSMLKGSLIYKKIFDKSEYLGTIKEEEMIEKLISVNLWSKLEQEQLDSIPKKIEDAKVQLYLAYKNFKSRDPIRKRIKDLNEEYVKLSKKRGILSEQTCEGLASITKSRYLICTNTFYENDDVFFEDYDQSDNNIVSDVAIKYLSFYVTDKRIRTISKNDVWKSFWGPGKAEGGVFNKPSIELTPQQRSLITWSKIYDSVLSSHECPASTVIEDDDMLDGWLIYQNRKAESERSKSAVSKKGSDVKGDEVFLFADTAEDAKRIHDLNDIQGKSTIKSLNKQLDNQSKKGKGLKTEQTVEAQLEMRQMANEQFKQKARG